MYYQDRPEAGTIKFIMPEFVSYLGERGVLCVGNGWHFCFRLGTFVFNKCSEIIIFTIIFVVKSVIKPKRVFVGIMLAQQQRRRPNITSQLANALVSGPVIAVDTGVEESCVRSVLEWC